MNEKKGMVEFGWIFSVIVGAVILFLAFYFISTNISEKKTVQETIEAQNLDAALNPFGYLGDVANITRMPLQLSEKSDITIECVSSGMTIGYDSIETAGIGKGSGTGIARKVYDKYIYSDLSGIQTKNLEGMAVSLKMPWRIADLIMLWPAEKKYCFTKSMPQDMRDEINRTEIPDVVAEYSEPCPEGSITIGMSCSGYDINVCNQGQENYISKNGVKIYYSGSALMYAAIFSEQNLYNCNLNRLGKRLALQGSLYESKANSTGCNAGNAAFEKMISASNDLSIADSNLKISNALDSIESASADIEIINGNCRLY